MNLREKLALQKKASLKQTATAKSQADVAGIKTSSSTTQSLDKLALQVSEQNDKLAEHIRKQEEAGVYSFSGKIRDVAELDADEFITKMKLLDQAVVEKTPDIRTFSMQIRKNLHQYPELTHLLSDEQLGILVKGMLTLAGEATEPKTKAAKTRKDNARIEDLSKISLDSLGSW